MTDAPKTIWRVAAYIPRHNDHGLASWPVKDHAGDGAVEYTLTTHSDALVAAAYKDNCVECCGTGKDIAGNTCHHRTPTNAQAAYDAAIAQARHEGWEAAQAENAKLREALNVIATHRAKCHEYDTDCGHEKRSFDEEDVRLMECQAKSALSGQDAEGET